MSAELPNGWNRKRLDELGFIGRGRSRYRPRNDPSLYGGPYPFFQTSDVKAAEFYLSEHSQTYNEKGLAQSKLWQPGTLCITIAANIAESAILSVEGCFPDSIVGFIADPQEADVRFVKYAIDTMKLQMQSISRGTTQDNLSLDKLLTFGIPVPPLATQHTIAAILSAYDDLIENNTQRIAVLEEMAQRIYREWFVHFRFPGHEDVGMVDSELGLIPERWQAEPIGKAVVTLGGGTPRTKVDEYWEDGNITWYTPSDLTSSGAMFISDSSRKINDLGLQKSSAKMFPAYSAMMTSRATVGVVAINTTPACTNQGFIICVPNDRLSVYYLYFWLLQGCEKIIQLASGATFKEINRTTFRKIPILIPDPDTHGRYVEIVEPIGAEIQNLLSVNSLLRRTRDLLLPRLVSGEVDVSDLPIDTGGLAA